MMGLIVDLFAGGGGASLGIEMALGRSPDVAVNHDADAIAMHTANHPDAKHYHEDVRKVSPARVCGGRPVDLLWCSPDCRHFSRAKGGKPVSKRVRGLAWMAVRWAKEVRPAVITLENVREFKEWGPLIPKLDARGREEHDAEGNPVLVPDPTRKGQSFKRWAGNLRGLGYEVAWRDLDAADYGAPTHRKRLFLVARCDGQPIAWPEPTHADPAALAGAQGGLFDRGLRPWRTAAECIDWSIPCPSIFERKRPLAENTLRRIAAGVVRYVLEAAEPFIVPLTHGGDPARVYGLGEPFRTITGANRGEMGLVEPYVVPVGYGEREGQRPRTHALGAPLPTNVGSNKHALVAPVVTRIGQTGGNGKYCNDTREPLTTITSKAEHCVAAATLIRPYILQANHGGHNFRTQDSAAPLNTVTGQRSHAVAAACLVHMNHGDKQWSDAREPLRTVTASGRHHAEVRAFLIKYYGTAIGQRLACPLGTATAKARYGLVTVMIGGEPYVLADIGMRMLSPRELARAQGFPDAYQLTGNKTAQVHKIGNSVCPPMAAAMVRANVRATEARRTA